MEKRYKICYMDSNLTFTDAGLEFVHSKDNHSYFNTYKDAEDWITENWTTNSNNKIKGNVKLTIIEFFQKP